MYYVVWNYFIGKSSDIVGAYINSKGDEYEVNLKCTSHESLRESDGYWSSPRPPKTSPAAEKGLWEFLYSYNECGFLRVGYGAVFI